MNQRPAWTDRLGATLESIYQARVTAAEREEQGADEYTATCGWCRGTTVAVVGPPRMTHVAVIWPTGGDQRDDWVICAMCHVELVRLIASRDPSNGPQDAPGGPAGPSGAEVPPISHPLDQGR